MYYVKKMTLANVCFDNVLRTVGIYARISSLLPNIVPFCGPPEQSSRAANHPSRGRLRLWGEYQFGSNRYHDNRRIAILVTASCAYYLCCRYVTPAITVFTTVAISAKQVLST